jgi:ADP-ribose pyrophosphatase
MSGYEAERRLRARARYHELRRERPDWFVNHPGGFEILVRDEDIDRAEAAAYGVLQAAHAADGQAGTPDHEWVMVGVLAEDAWGVVLRDAVRTPAGDYRVYRREMNAPKRPGGIVALTKLRDQVVLLKHYRHALRKFEWEIPRGFSRPGEEPAAALRRQLLEEIQAAPLEHRFVGLLEPDGGRSGDAVQVFCATIGSFGDPESGEAIKRLELIGVDELRRRIAANEITDALTLAAIAKCHCAGELTI